MKNTIRDLKWFLDYISNDLENTPKDEFLCNVFIGWKDEVTKDELSFIFDEYWKLSATERSCLSFNWFEWLYSTFELIDF